MPRKTDEGEEPEEPKPVEFVRGPDGNPIPKSEEK